MNKFILLFAISCACPLFAAEPPEWYTATPYSIAEFPVDMAEAESILPVSYTDMEAGAITVSVADRPVPRTATPEPDTLLLITAGLGVLLIAVSIRRPKRNPTNWPR